MENRGMGFPGASGAIMKDEAGEAAGGKSSRGGMGASSTPQRTPRCFMAHCPRGQRATSKLLSPGKC